MSAVADVADSILQHCDRTRATEARLALSRLLWQPLQTLSIPLRNDCIVHPDNDILLLSHSSKIAQPGGLYSCSICGKTFRSEYYLDKHQARHHPLLRHPNSSTCLSDLCGSIIPCIPLNSPPSPSVSTVRLEKEDNGQPQEDLTRKGTYCSDRKERRRKVLMCVDTYRRCLDKEGRWTESILRRLKRDLCERALKVECMPRGQVRSVVGIPDRVLRPTANREISLLSLWFVLLIALLRLLFWGRTVLRRCHEEERRVHHESKNAPEETMRRRRRRVRRSHR